MTTRSRVIRITGMTAPQTRTEANAQTLSFTGILARALSHGGGVTTILAPLSTAEAEYGSSPDNDVVVGVTAPTSLSAHYVFHALAFIDHHWDSGRLRLLVDTPRPDLMMSSLRACLANPEKTYLKPLYAGRPGYAQKNTLLLSRALSGLNRLVNEPWPPTVYPALPWKPPKVAAWREQHPGRLIGLNLDALACDRGQPAPDTAATAWALDSMRTRWAKQLRRHVVNQAVAMRPSRRATDADVRQMLRHALAAGVSPDDRGGTWWSHRYTQAMDARIPVATDWRESQALDETWSILPSTIETLSYQDRVALADEQRRVWFNAVPTVDEAVEQTLHAVGLE